MTSLDFTEDNDSINAIDRFYESRHKNRNYLGLSQAGHECPRWLWFKHNGLKPKHLAGRTLRLFELGNLVEQQMYLDFTSAGFFVSNRQMPVKYTYNNITLNGHIDGTIEGLFESSKRHLWECKTINDKGFKQLLKDGYEAYNEQYKWQLQFYMLDLGLDRSFVTVYNKNTSELYQERIKLRKRETIKKLHSIFEILEQPACLGKRVCPRSDWYKAKMCDYKEVCFK